MTLIDYSVLFLQLSLCMIDSRTCGMTNYELLR